MLRGKDIANECVELLGQGLEPCGFVLIPSGAEHLGEVEERRRLEIGEIGVLDERGRLARKLFARLATSRKDLRSDTAPEDLRHDVVGGCELLADRGEPPCLVVTTLPDLAQVALLLE